MLISSCAFAVGSSWKSQLTSNIETRVVDSHLAYRALTVKGQLLLLPYPPLDPGEEVFAVGDFVCVGCKTKVFNAYKYGVWFKGDVDPKGALMSVAMSCLGSDELLYRLKARVAELEYRDTVVAQISLILKRPSSESILFDIFSTTHSHHKGVEEEDRSKFLLFRSSLRAILSKHIKEVYPKAEGGEEK